MTVPLEHPKAWPALGTVSEVEPTAPPLHPDDLRILRADAARSAARLRAGALDEAQVPAAMMTAAGSADEEARRLVAVRDYLLAMAVRYHSLAKRWQQASSARHGDDDPTLPAIGESTFGGIDGSFPPLGEEDTRWCESGEVDTEAWRGGPDRRTDTQAIPLIRPRRAKRPRES